MQTKKRLLLNIIIIIIIISPAKNLPFQSFALITIKQVKKRIIWTPPPI